MAIKATGGPVVALATIAHVSEYELTAATLKNIRAAQAKALCAEDPEFWKRQSDKRYATLLGIERVTRLDPALPCGKQDRRGWVTMTVSG